MPLILKPKTGRDGHAKPLSVMFLKMDVPVDREKTYKARVGQILTLLGVSHSTLYERIKRGTFPKADGKDTRPYWWKETLQKFVLDANLSCDGSKSSSGNQLVTNPTVTLEADK